MAPEYGFTARLSFGDSDPPTEAYDLLSESLGATDDLSNLEGLRGTRSHFANRTRVTRRRVGGSVTMQPTPAELRNMLRRTFGTESGSGPYTYAVAETLPTFVGIVDKGGGVHKFTGLAVGSATFRGSSGAPLEATYNLVGQAETTGASFPAVTLDATGVPFVFSDLVLTVGGDAHQCFDFELTVDNAIDADRFLNSLTLTGVNPTDRTVGVRFTLPYGDSAALYDAGSDPAGVAATATFTNGGYSLAFTFPALQWGRATPAVNGRGEITHVVAAAARRTSGAAEVSATLDLTP